MRLILRGTLLIPPLAGVLFSSCHQARQIGSGISTGTAYVGRPVVAGSKKLADATVSGTKKLGDATASGSRMIADATVAGSKKVAGATVAGAKSLAAGATRLVTFGSANRKPAPAPLTPAAAKTDDPALPAAHVFPSKGLMVSESELGPDATRLEATAVTLAGGWTLNGNSVAYHLEPGADDPTALLVKGSPATASLKSEDTTTQATAREFHYHAANQVLTLKGSPVLTSSSTTITATSAATLIKIHLPTGAISIDGPARWGGG